MNKYIKYIYKNKKIKGGSYCEDMIYFDYNKVQNINVKYNELITNTSFDFQHKNFLFLRKNEEIIERYINNKEYFFYYLVKNILHTKNYDSIYIYLKNSYIFNQLCIGYIRLKDYEEYLQEISQILKKNYVDTSKPAQQKQIEKMIHKFDKIYGSMPTITTTFENLYTKILEIQQISDINIKVNEYTLIIDFLLMHVSLLIDYNIAFICDIIENSSEFSINAKYNVECHKNIENIININNNINKSYANDEIRIFQQSIILIGINEIHMINFILHSLFILFG